MYAITSKSYRSISSASDLQTGESAVAQVPESVLLEIAKIEAKDKRTDALRNTDWTQMADAKLTGLEKAAWAAYRQALRDLPNLSGFPNVPWPVVPGVIVEADTVPKAEI